MLFGKLLNGRLTDIQHGDGKRTWPDGSTDVPLVAQPTMLPPWGYDAVNKLATAGVRTNAEKLAQVQYALAIQSAPAVWASLSPQEQAAINAFIAITAVAALAAFRNN